MIVYWVTRIAALDSAGFSPLFSLTTLFSFYKIFLNKATRVPWQLNDWRLHGMHMISTVQKWLIGQYNYENQPGPVWVPYGMGYPVCNPSPSCTRVTAGNHAGGSREIWHMGPTWEPSGRHLSLSLTQQSASCTFLQAPPLALLYSRQPNGSSLPRIIMTILTLQ